MYECCTIEWGSWLASTSIIKLEAGKKTLKVVSSQKLIRTESCARIMLIRRKSSRSCFSTLFVGSNLRSSLRQLSQQGEDKGEGKKLWNTSEAVKTRFRKWLHSRQFSNSRSRWKISPTTSRHTRMTSYFCHLAINRFCSVFCLKSVPVNAQFRDASTGWRSLHSDEAFPPKNNRDACAKFFAW